MKRKLFRIVLGILLLSALFLLNYTFDNTVKGAFKRGSEIEFRLFAKPGFERWSAFEFRFLKAFYYTLSLRVYLGALAERYTTCPPFAKDPIIRTADVVTEICPYYYDIYYIANGYLTWDFGEVKKANELLEKAIKHRPDKAVYYFLLGFNYFYFLKDNEKAVEYLMKASEVSDNPRYAHLASKLLYASGRTEIAIEVLKAMIKNAKEEGWRKALEVRLSALEGIYTIERAVETFKNRFGRLPKDIEELKASGILTRIPVDPYGGKFYIDEEGNVKTTSNLTYVR